MFFATIVLTTGLMFKPSLPLDNDKHASPSLITEMYLAGEHSVDLQCA